jgi:hypothetical protein
LLAFIDGAKAARYWTLVTPWAVLTQTVEGSTLRARRFAVRFANRATTVREWYHPGKLASFRHNALRELDTDGSIGLK